MAGKVALLLWGDCVVALAGWCPLSPTGAQTTQLLVEPPWVPAVLWDRVTLTCQGSGTAGDTTWYQDGQRWGQNRRNSFTVSENGTYTCDRPGTGRSPSVTVLNDQLVLQVPVQTLLEGDTVTLRCRVKQDKMVSRVRFYKDNKDPGGFLRGTNFWPSQSAPVTVTVHELFTVPVLEGPPELTDGSPLNVSCLSTPSPLRPPAPLLHLFYRDGQLVGGPQGSPQLLVPAVGISHSGNYSCQVHTEGGTVRKSSARLRVTVRSECGDGHGEHPQPSQVCPGDPVTLRCSVQVGSAPVTFTWLHNGQEVARGPLLELGNVSVGHSGTYQCVATNQLGQDGHRVFRALSPELALEVTSASPWVTGGVLSVTMVFRTPRVQGDTDVSLSVPSSGCECRQDPPVPGPAPGCHWGLSLLAPAGWVTMGEDGCPGVRGSPQSRGRTRAAPRAPELGETEPKGTSLRGPGRFRENLDGVGWAPGASLGGL
uniref:Ig-like domain-containing protein n=1 Tax=Cyanoderma ruficeps TaxID=181631 RepID=A0A8C3XFR0_9PASS